MEKELARMAEADENSRLRMKAQRKDEVAAAMLEYEKRKLAEGVTLTPHVAESRTAVRMMVRDEERMALEKVSKKKFFFPALWWVGVTIHRYHIKSTAVLCIYMKEGISEKASDSMERAINFYVE